MIKAINGVPHSLKYRPDIDGLRAVAVLSVLFFHAFPEALPGGFIGVDIFFVISGFLISSILFEQVEKGQFTFLNFYKKRVLRIFPALFVVLFSVFIFGWIFLYPHELGSLSRHIFTGSTFLSNILLWFEVDYFDAAAETKPLLHLWSLGVEEQFYIVWPVFILLNFKFGIKHSFLFIALILISFGINIFFIEKSPMTSFYLPFSRLWELGIGSMISYLNFRYHDHFFSKKTTLSNIYSISGLVIIALSLFLLNKTMPFPGWVALLPVAGASLVLIASPEAVFNRFILANPVAIFIGLISYPLYLWHWPVLSFGQLIAGNALNSYVKLLLLFICVVLAWLTYKYIEFPIRVKKWKYVGARELTIAVFTIGFIGLGLNLQKEHLKTLLSIYNNPNIIAALNDWEFPKNLKALNKNDSQAYVVDKDVPVKVVFFGDSHVQQYAPAVVDAYKNHQFENSLFITGGGCLPIPEVREAHHKYCDTLYDNLYKFIQANKSVDKIVISAAWNSYFNVHQDAESSYSYKMIYNNHTYTLGNQLFNQVALTRLVGVTDELSKKYKVFIILDNPKDERFDPNFLGGFIHVNRFNLLTSHRQTATLNQDYSFPLSSQNQSISMMMQKAFAGKAVTIIDPRDQVCPDNICKPFNAHGKPIYKDSNHMRPYYVRENVAMLRPIRMAHLTQ